MSRRHAVGAAALLGVLVLVLAPAPALAHGAGGSSTGGGASTPLLLAGVALVAGGLAARSKARTAAVPIGLIAAGVALGVASVFVGGGDSADRPDVHIAVVEPADGAAVSAGQPVAVRVEVDGPVASGPEDKTGGHLHLSVDGKLQQMPYATSAEVTLDPGQHTVTVEYVDNKHLSYDPPIAHEVDVTAS